MPPLGIDRPGDKLHVVESLLNVGHDRAWAHGLVVALGLMILRGIPVIVVIVLVVLAVLENRLNRVPGEVIQREGMHLRKMRDGTQE